MTQEQNRGKWSKRYDVGGIRFSNEPIVHGPTGITTSFEKQIGDSVEIVTRYDTLDEHNRRWIMTAQYEDGRSQRTVTTQHSDMFGATIQFHETEEAVSPLKLHINPETIIHNPETFHIQDIRITYAQSGAFSHIDFDIASHSMFNEDEIRSRPLEENLAELASIFKDISGDPESLFYAPETDGKPTSADAHMALSGFFAKGKLIQWSEEQKAQVDYDLDMLTTYLDEAFGEEVEPEHLHALASYLIPSLVRVLPDDYVVLAGEDREKAFDKALTDATVEVLHLYDNNIRQQGEYTVSLFANPQNGDEDIFVAFPEHTGLPELVGVKVEPVAGGLATQPFQYEDSIFVMRKGDEKISVSMIPILDKTTAFTFIVPRTLDINAILQDMRSDSPMDWQFAVNKISLGFDLTQL